MRPRLSLIAIAFGGVALVSALAIGCGGGGSSDSTSAGAGANYQGAATTSTTASTGGAATVARVRAVPTTAPLESWTVTVTGYQPAAA